MKCAWWNLGGKTCDREAVDGCSDCDIIGAKVCEEHECRCSKRRRERAAKAALEAPNFDEPIGVE